MNAQQPTDPGRPGGAAEALETVAGAGVWLAIADGHAEITLARTDQQNTLDSRALAGLAGALRRIDQDHTVQGVLLKSSVADVFCSGGNYVDLEHPGRPSPHYGPQLTACFDLWTARRVPVVSIVAGSARAFGAALALTSDVTIATPAASFELPEMSRGVVPSFAIALLRTRHTSRLVRELTLTTGTISAENAERRGLINMTTPNSSDAEQHARTLFGSWSQIGTAPIRKAMSTLAEIDAAADHATVRQIAIAGVEDQLQCFRNGQTDQSYLGLQDSTSRRTSPPTDPSAR